MWGPRISFILNHDMGLNRDEILEQFEEFRKEIDDQNDKRERLIKASQHRCLDHKADVSA